MSRETYVWDGEKMVPKSSDFAPSPKIHVIGDTLPQALVHPATGLVTDSKSRFRRETKASGCVELGSDAPREPRRPDINIEPSRQTISQVYESMR